MSVSFLINRHTFLTHWHLNSQTSSYKGHDFREELRDHHQQSPVLISYWCGTQTCHFLRIICNTKTKIKQLQTVKLMYEYCLLFRMLEDNCCPLHILFHISDLWTLLKFTEMECEGGAVLGQNGKIELTIQLLKTYKCEKCKWGVSVTN